MTEVTRILSAIDSGEPCADEQLLPLVCNELRRLAAQKLAHKKPGQTLDATALVHEAYLKLVPTANAKPPAGRHRSAVGPIPKKSGIIHLSTVRFGPTLRRLASGLTSWQHVVPISRLTI